MEGITQQPLVCHSAGAPIDWCVLEVNSLELGSSTCWYASAKISDMPVSCCSDGLVSTSNNLWCTGVH